MSNGKPGRPRGGRGRHPRLPGSTVPPALVDLVERAADHRALSRADWLRRTIADAALDDAIEDPTADASELRELVADLAQCDDVAIASLAAGWLQFVG